MLEERGFLATARAGDRDTLVNDAAQKAIERFDEVMRELVKYVDVVIANEEDCQAALGIEADVDVHSGKLSHDVYRDLAAKVLKAYPNVKTIAIVQPQFFVRT